MTAKKEKRILRIGKISSINYDNGTARVIYDDRQGDTTTELPFIAWEYWMPKIGEQVLVAKLESGGTAGVILGTVWHEKKRPPMPGEKRYHKELSRAKKLHAYADYTDDSDQLILKAGRVLILVNDGADSMDLYQEITDLKARVSALERRVSAVESRV